MLKSKSYKKIMLILFIFFILICHQKDKFIITCSLWGARITMLKFQVIITHLYLTHWTYVLFAILKELFQTTESFLRKKMCFKAVVSPDVLNLFSRI